MVYFKFKQDQLATNFKDLIFSKKIVIISFKIFNLFASLQILIYHLFKLVKKQDWFSACMKFYINIGC